MTERPQIVMGAPAPEDPLLDTTLAQGFTAPAPRDLELHDWRQLPRESRAWPATLAGLLGVLVLSLPLWVPAVLRIATAETVVPQDRVAASLGLLLTLLMVAGVRWLVDRVVVQVLAIDDGRLALGPPHARVSADVQALQWCARLGPVLLVQGRWRSSKVGRDRDGVRLIADVFDLPLATVQARFEDACPGLGARTPTLAQALGALVRRPPPVLRAAVGVVSLVLMTALALL